MSTADTLKACGTKHALRAFRAQRTKVPCYIENPARVARREFKIVTCLLAVGRNLGMCTWCRLTPDLCREFFYVATKQRRPCPALLVLGSWVAKILEQDTIYLASITAPCNDCRRERDVGFSGDWRLATGALRGQPCADSRYDNAHKRFMMRLLRNSFVRRRASSCRSRCYSNVLHM
jgi:hypothetical protein